MTATTGHTPEPAVGQVWADNDPRCEGRRILRIDRVWEAPAGRASSVDCTVLTDWEGNPPPSPRRTTIRADRFRPTSSGYRYLRTEDGAS